METKNALSALAALAQESRLAAFRYLVQIGPEGVAASRISEELAIPPSSLSFHLKELLNADWSRRASKAASSFTPRASRP